MPAALILTLDAALERCSVGLVDGGRVVVALNGEEGRGSAALLPALVREALYQAQIAATSLSAIAVTVGPGSFTGVRAAIAVATGIGVATGVPVLGVTVGAALRARAGQGQTRPVWVAIDSKRQTVFIDDGCGIATHALDALPTPSGPVAIAGNAAKSVASRLAARGFDIHLLPQREPDPLGIAAAARSPVPAQPLYVDPPEARPGASQRPQPA